MDEEINQDAVALQFALAGRMDAHNLAVLNRFGQVSPHQSLFQTGAGVGCQAAVLRRNLVVQVVVKVQHGAVHALQNQFQLVGVRF